MIMVPNSARLLKRFLDIPAFTGCARGMVMRLVLAFALRRGRMSCSRAGGAILTEPVHRSQITRFLCRPRWQERDFNGPLREALLQLESALGVFVFLVDLTLCSRSGKRVQNTYSTGNRRRRPAKGRRYGSHKRAPRTCHGFTFGLLLTPSGYRLPFQIPHYTKEYCAQKGLKHRTTAEAAAELIRRLPLPEGAEVIVVGDTAYDAEVVRQACDERKYQWIFPANPERVFEGPKGKRPRLRTRLKEWRRLSPRTIRLRASTGKFAVHRRLSKWRLGPKTKPRVYHAHQETRDVRSVGRVRLVFSTMKPNLKKATPDDVKILMTNAAGRSLSEILELYALRWQVELFFKELKSTLGFHQYCFERFEAVEAWANVAITTVLFLEWMRATKLRRRNLSSKQREWWRTQRLHGLCEAFHQQVQRDELKLIEERLKTHGGTARLKRWIRNATPSEYRVPG